MRVFAPLAGNICCLVLFVALAALIIGAAWIVARAERVQATARGYPASRYPTRRLAASVDHRFSHMGYKGRSAACSMLQ